MPTKPTKAASLPPVRVRHEPPTLEEAVVAAQGLSDDVEHQIEIAAGLMGLPGDARVRAAVLAAPKLAISRDRSWGDEPAGMPAMAPRRPASAPVVVERRTRGFASPGLRVTPRPGRAWGRE